MTISLDPSQTSYGALATTAPPNGGSPWAQGLQTLATDLGVSTDDLQAARSSGQSLADFAQSKGISRGTLIDAVKDSFTANAPAGTTPPSADQLTAMANQMVDRTPGGGGHHHHHHGGGGGQTQAVQMPDSSLLSALTGTTSTDGASTDQTLAQLLQNLTSSQDSSSSSSDSTSTSLQQLLQQLTTSSSYSSSGTSGALSGSLGLNAFA